MATKKPAAGHHPAPEKPEIEQSILDSKATLATSTDKEAQQQAYPDAIAHDTAQESVDNQTELQEEQPANPPLDMAQAPTGDEAEKPKPDHSAKAKAIKDEVKESADLASAKKEDLVGEAPIIMKSDHEKVLGAKKVNFGKGGTLKVEGLGRPQNGLAGAEYDVTVRIADDRTLVLHHIPADLLE